ncbi:acyl--CoA ligase [Sphingomonas sp. KRR8]|uniref:class I adenylate-forming enzyme family protein n=1 Tax=Sphingomonas sp. KRR8 TaxID=2942996 RepID=UPI00201FBD16|nr:class I adenylate-forming enzyme family protein [Sphingomonas sp. KRR8]URD59912.1 acyl--CoA ligase [Sphingomonas sp. KRR8]
MTLHGLYDLAEARWSERPAIICDERTWNYADLGRWSRRLAAGLLEQGVRTGDHVALILGNQPEYVALKIALSRLGAVAVPLNMHGRRSDFRYLLEQSDATMLITLNRFREVDYLAELDGILPAKLKRLFVLPTDDQPRDGVGAAFAELEADAEAVNLPSIDPHWLVDLIYTSGTTGDPKGVMISHDMLTRTAFASAYARAFEDARRIIFALPMFHVFGYVEGMLAAPWVGGAIVPQVRFDSGRFLAACARHRPTDALLIPAMSLALIDAVRAGAPRPETLRAALASGGRAPERLWQELNDTLGISEITTGYGMTEVTASSTVTRPDDPADRLLNSNGRLRDAGPAAAAEPHQRLVQYRVLDPETGAELPPGAIGHLVAKGPGVTRGYYNKPAETALSFTPDGWLLTGDLGTLDADGYVTLVGRLKESYRCGGEQVLPTEIEDLLTGHADILAAHVVPLPDERMGEVGVACLVPRPGRSPDLADVDRFARARLARYKVPRHYLVLAASEVPATASGRARKHLLTALAKDRITPP